MPNAHLSKMKSTIFILLSALSQISISQQTDCNTCFVKMEAKTKSAKNETLFNLAPLCHENWNFLVGTKPIACVLTFEDTITALRSLLKFEGDTDLVSLIARNHLSSNPNRTDYFVPDDSLYQTTVEIHALFIFNILIEPKPFYLATYPRLQAKKLGSPRFDLMFEQNDPRLKIIFDYYEKWLERCVLKKTLKIGYYPLDGSNYSWL